MSRGIAFVLASWQLDAPAGMERAVAAAVLGLAQLGHRPHIITAVPPAPNLLGLPVHHLASLSVRLPTDDDELRAAVTAAEPAIAAELTDLYQRHNIDTAIYVDALWGLGAVMPTASPAHRVLAAHVVGHDTDLCATLDRQPTAVVVPSPVVAANATQRGYDSSGWAVVPNALLTEITPCGEEQRELLRRTGPIRVLARLGREKGVDALLEHTPAALGRPIDVALAAAGFETHPGSQDEVWTRCTAHHHRSLGLTIRGSLPWQDVPGWLGQAAVTIVPSLAETFGLVALESMSTGTPVVAHDVGNLPTLIGDGGVLVPADEGPAGLWRGARDLLVSDVHYGQISRAAYYRARDYRPAQVADQLLKVVS